MAILKAVRCVAQRKQSPKSDSLTPSTLPVAKILSIKFDAPTNKIQRSDEQANAQRPSSSFRCRHRPRIHLFAETKPPPVPPSPQHSLGAVCRTTHAQRRLSPPNRRPPPLRCCSPLPPSTAVHHRNSASGVAHRTRTTSLKVVGCPRRPLRPTLGNPRARAAQRASTHGPSLRRSPRGHPQPRFHP